MFDQQGNIFAAFAQGGQAQANHIQSMEQVFTEQTLFDAFFQILMGSRDDTHIHFNRLMTADAVELAITQNTQQARLQVGWHVTNFIQKQSAAIGLFKASAPRRLCAGKRAAFMTKQFGFQQVFGNRCRVNGDKGCSARGLWRCRALATSSLPVPDSPLINTVAWERLKRPIARNTSCMAGA